MERRADDPDKAQQIDGEFLADHSQTLHRRLRKDFDRPTAYETAQQKHRTTTIRTDEMSTKNEDEMFRKDSGMDLVSQTFLRRAGKWNAETEMRIHITELIDSSSSECCVIG
ncbi:unnamed protein product [Nippostrongylus brasiliensis]|uniref:Uncharacterized protein n=1 Tax=Nippostrongylus brasiliensis TaxID=27835 RepID=A0A0N4XWN2_NIPBR|nr:unnamed protein product [Nippostrongylus brasiliensis]